jgi:hypothetical protein
MLVRMEKKEPFTLFRGMYIGAVIVKTVWTFLKKLKFLWPNNPFSKYILKEDKIRTS